MSKHWSDRIEQNIEGPDNPDRLCSASIAISLKRIADALEKANAPNITEAKPVELVGEVRLDMTAINRMIDDAIKDNPLVGNIKPGLVPQGLRR